MWNRWTSTKMIAGLLTIALLAGCFVGWRMWIAPTRIALFNMKDFQVAEMMEANGNPFVRISRIAEGELVEARLDRYRLLIIFGMGLTLTPEEQQAVEAAVAEGTRVYVTGMTNDSTDVASLRGEEREAVSGYLTNGGKENLRRLCNYARRVLDGKAVFSEPVEEPVVIPDDALFHTAGETLFESVDGYQKWYEEAGLFQPEQPKIALITSIMGAGSLNRSYVRGLVEGIETRGWNAYPISGFLKRLEFLEAIAPDLVVYVPHGRLAPGQSDEMLAWLEKRNVPVLSPIDVFMPYEEWIGTQQGIAGGMLSQTIAMPELDGGIEPYAFAAQFPDENGLFVSRAVPERLDTLLNRIDRWLALRRKDNAEKRVAIVYYKGPGLSAMVAGGMEVAPSLLNLLHELKKAGYDTGPLPESVDAFMKDINTKGPVLGPYAEGAFDAFLENGEPELVGTEDYLKWVGEALHPDLWADVERIYGPAPGSYLSLTKEGASFLALPRVQYGNVVILPQLLPGIGEDIGGLVHGAKTAPPHPYIAEYLWIRYGFQADAVMHFGTHGSFEFTPWKQTGLCHLDWADTLLGDLPHPYVYVINNIGEAIIAKRRSYATIVSHLTPPFTEAEAYGPMQELQQAVDSWSQTDDGALKTQYREEIAALVAELELHKDIGIDNTDSRTWNEEEMAKLHNYLYTVGQEKITRGLYTLGKPYTEAEAIETARLMALDPVAWSMAQLDIARGIYPSAQVEDPAFFDTHYRQEAFARIDAILAAEKTAEDFIPAEDLDHMRQWDLAHKSMTDDEFFAAMLGMAGQTEEGAEPAVNLERTRELTMNLAAEDSIRDMLLSFKDEEKFERAKLALDPHQLAKARKVARFIPTMREALDAFARDDVKEVIELMLNPENRGEVFRVLENPNVQAEIGKKRELVRRQQAGQALEKARRNDLFLVADDVALEDQLRQWERERVEQFKDHLGFYVNHNGLADAVEARGENDADAVAALMRHPSMLKNAIKAADNRIAQLESEEKETVEAIRASYEALSSVRDYRDGLLASSRAEIEGVLDALDGGYIPPSSGGDAIANPRAIPAGRNLAAIDAEKCPTEAAWKTGAKLAEETIARKRAETGEYPRKMAISLWGGEFIRTEGAPIAMILYMLGCEPVRNSRGAVHDIRLIPAEELDRPRIDVVVQTSGQFRDVAASRIFLINRAVKLASEAPDPPDAVNHVREGTLAAERVMKEKGLSPLDARDLSTARVFGGVNGEYGAAIMGLVEAGDKWESDEEIANQYLNNMGAVYTEENWGRFAAGAFEAALQNTDTLVHSRSSNTWGPLSLDHVYEFMGGMSAAIRQVTGEDADAVFADLRNGSAPVIQGAREAIWTETRSTLMNPKYIQDLQKGGATSADTFAETFRNTYGWNAMRPEIIDDEVWDNLYDVYVEDKYALDMEAYFREKNPYALQEMSAVMLETARKGLWEANAAQIRRLATLHAELVKDHKAGCTGFICDNAKLRDMIAGQLPEDLRQAYNTAIDDVRIGAAAEQVEGMTLEKEPDPIAKAAELVRENPALTAGLVLVAAALVGFVVFGARRRTW